MMGDRIRLARRKSGYSLQALSAAIAGRVSPQMIGKYERNESLPRSSVIIALAEALDVSVGYLFDRWDLTLGDIELRVATNASQRARSKLEVEVLSWLDSYLQIEAILELDDPEWRFPLETPPVRIRDGDIEEFAESLRIAWRLGAGPISNMTEFLESRGIRVLCIPMAKSISALTCVASSSTSERKFPAIVVNRTHALERRRFTLAHELGQRLLQTDNPDLTDRNRWATRLAGALLMPREHLLREVGEHRNSLSYQELIHVKRIYRVSGAALLKRLRELDIISLSTLQYMFQSVARDWKTSEPAELEPADMRGQFEGSSRFERLCCRALAEREISPVRASSLLGADESTINHMLWGATIEEGATKDDNYHNRRVDLD